MYAQAETSPISSPSLIRFARMLLISLYILFFLWACVLITTDEKSIHAWLVMLSAVQLIPCAVFVATGNIDLPLFGLFQAFFGNTMNRFHQLSGLRAIDPYFLMSQKEEVACTLLLLFTFYALRYTVFLRWSGGAQYETLQLSPRTYWRLGVASLIMQIVPLPIPGSLRTLWEGAITVVNLIVITSGCPERPSLPYWFRGAMIVLGFYLFVATATMGALGTLCSQLLLLAFLQRRLMHYVKILVPLVLVGIVLQNIKGNYRNAVWYGDYSQSERLSLLSALLSDKLSTTSLARQARDEDDADSDFSAESDIFWTGVSRGGDDSLERVLRYTPTRVPFWNGETYATALYIFIPRFIWPDKPGRDFWNKYGRLYDILVPDDYTTSVAVGFLAEGYMNYGYTGLYGIAIFMGLFMAFTQFIPTYLMGRPVALAFILFAFPFNWAADLGTIVNIVAINFVMLVLAKTYLKRAL